jgi:hypothetical protein
MKTVSVVAWAVVGALTAGCGGSSGPAPAKLAGTVKLNGKPVGYGRVEFHMESGQVVKAAIGVDGSYSMHNPPRGAAKVVVVTGEPPIAAAAAGAAAPPPKFEKVDVPEKYGDPAKTPLSYVIKDGPATYDVLLES